ncbi:DNA-binding transcriptional LysR family regulator [Nonomuraea thailandensis]|uniref:DNA-binding transcriptional LysR family regulator n=1 Tax=Nonomuraea thailandensis TaxID=1188745 RepID=A0A9X2GG50_9ACTN|nr:LysR family transcriptional regulator [Nonomuraea thailandensis]MCP2357035.1 DNA-binding transcriptional LysR family regulator [Nonomuraea thailandensis]
MELRDIEIFLTLAEELHFSRTAEKLHITQARVSQSIKKQERRVGAPLFGRTSRAVRLTPIGSRLRDDLRQAYDLINGGLERAAGVAQGIRGTLRLGVMGALGNELRPLIEAFAERHPGCEVQVTEFHFSDPFTALRSGEADLQLMWLPVREPDLVVGPVVLTEGRVLAVAGSSDLAGRASVSMEDLAGRPVLDPGTDGPGYWFEGMLPASTPSGAPVPRGPRVRTFHEALALVAAGRIVCPLNAHVTRYYNYPGIVCLPIHDAPSTEWALVRRSAGETPLVRAFVRTGSDLGMLAI